MTLEYEENMESDNSRFGKILSEMFDTYKKKMPTTAIVSAKQFKSLATYQQLHVSTTN